MEVGFSYWDALHDGECKQDKNKLAPTMPWCKNLAKQTTSASAGKCIDVRLVGDGHQGCTKDLDKADGNVETEHSEQEHLCGANIGR